MIRLTVEETNLLSIYNEDGKRGLTKHQRCAAVHGRGYAGTGETHPCENRTSDRK